MTSNDTENWRWSQEEVQTIKIYEIVMITKMSWFRGKKRSGWLEDILYENISVMMRRVWKKDQLSFFHGFCCRQDVEGDGMGSWRIQMIHTVSYYTTYFSRRRTSWSSTRSGRGIGTNVINSTRGNHFCMLRRRVDLWDTTTSRCMELREYRERKRWTEQHGEKKEFNNNMLKNEKLLMTYLKYRSRRSERVTREGIDKIIYEWLGDEGEDVESILKISKILWQSSSERLTCRGWVSAHNCKKQEKFTRSQDYGKEWWILSVDRIEIFVILIFKEDYKMTDLWTAKGTDGESESRISKGKCGLNCITYSRCTWIGVSRINGVDPDLRAKLLTSQGGSTSTVKNYDSIDYVLYDTWRDEGVRSIVDINEIRRCRMITYASILNSTIARSYSYVYVPKCSATPKRSLSRSRHYETCNDSLLSHRLALYSSPSLSSSSQKHTEEAIICLSLCSFLSLQRVS